MINRHLLLTGCFFACFSSSTIAQDGTPLLRWGNEPGKSDQATAGDAMKKLTADFAEFKNRMQQLEEQQARHSDTMKQKLQAMQEMLHTMQLSCDRLNRDMVADKSAGGITQTSASVPATKKPIEDGGRVEPVAGDAVMRKLDEMNVTMQDLSKLALQVQVNTRSVTDLKKQFDAMQLEFIQAQNDIGKLQQDMVRLNNRVDGVRPTDPGTTDRSRSSLSLPLPPESQSNTANKPATAAAVTQGTLKLVNNYPLTVSVVVDSQLYTLRPNDTLNLNRNPGYVTYEVVGIQGNTVRTITANETLTIQIVPR